MSVKLLTEHYLEFLSLKGGCTGSSESTLFKMSHIVGNHMSRRLILCLTTADIGRIKSGKYVLRGLRTNATKYFPH